MTRATRDESSAASHRKRACEHHDKEEVPTRAPSIGGYDNEVLGRSWILCHSTRRNHLHGYRKAERFFIMREMDEEDWVSAVMMAMEGEALSWYHWWQGESEDDGD